MSEKISENLWNKENILKDYGSKEQFNEHIFEQYKTYIESANKISDRRNTANTLFLSINSLIITVVTFLYKGNIQLENQWYIFFPLIAVLSLCFFWRRLILSYKQLNTAKFKVINEFEKRLPSRPYVSAEWSALGKGEDSKLYKPLTDIESMIPVVFAVLYCVGALITIF